ncbi:formylmethanofuran dehydrogenase subunit A [Methanococcus aeolicus]|uniref:formylmethanofuran dehydrogenase subunit A n=1 Tax=Methanococcus aeolicus TaxID=42879 RepID=UPI0021C99B25|nr:formylmethanofuran dehydrogenase subunit A [Methanococcus aeolicus]UXM85174.1 formylmethanofuran dehydrogenase subunit A [Methanococcus aeolicus]
MNLIIKNGFVFDPLNKIDGEKMDIFVKNGKIVQSLSPGEKKKAKIIDATNKTIMPGGVDSHTHIAGAKVTTGRMMCPELQYDTPISKTENTHCGSGNIVPSSYIIGYKYASMGYTSLFEPAIPPMLARHTHEELYHIPIVDKAGYLLLGNNWFVMKYLKEGDIDKAAAYVGWMLNTHKAYGIKCVNPAGVENWGWGMDVSSLDEANIHFEVTPREVIEGLCEVNEILGCPMSMHLHANNLGHPGNWEITRDSLEIPKNIGVTSKKHNSKKNIVNLDSKNNEIELEKTKIEWEREQNIYMTHVQFNAFGGTSWKDFESGTKGIIDYVNKSKHAIIDSGCVVFGQTICMTGDGPSIYGLGALTGGKWTNCDVELECGSGIAPMNYKKKNGVHATQWAMGLELILGIDDPWKVIMTTDSPNGGCFVHYPKIIAWLMSKKGRENTLNEVHKWASDRTDLPGMDREMSLYDIATVTRATAAKCVGLAHKKGHLGVGADADIAIYDINPNTLDVNDYDGIVNKFSCTEYTIKGGVIVSKGDKIVDASNGTTRFCNVSLPDEQVYQDVFKDIESWFKKYYSLRLKNYPTTDKYLTNPEAVNIGE